MKLQSALIAHSVDLAAYTNDVVRRASRVLSTADADIVAELAKQLETLAPSQFKVSRLLVLLRSVRELNAAAYAALNKQLRLDLSEIAVYEAGFGKDLVEKATKLPAKLITEAQAIAAGEEVPLRGRLMSQWSESLARRRFERLQDYLSMSYVEGKTVDEMVRGVRGTKAGKFMDGLLAITRREAETVVRTAVGHYAQAAREALFAANDDIVKQVIWLSTLDSRTSPECRLRDGLAYTADDHAPVGHDIPWLGGPGRIHWSCRSTCIPNLQGFLGGPKERASEDGPVSAKLTYAQWLKKQSSARQDEILGPSRGQLMREGKYTLDRFYNLQGRYLTLDELRKRDAATFRELGL